MQVLLTYTTFIVAVAIAGPASWQRVLTRGPTVGNIGGHEVGAEDVTPATPEERPFQVSIQDTALTDGEHFCGGALYSDSIVITSAHCIAPYIDRPQHLQIVTGDFRMSLTEGHEQVVQVSRILSHSGYNIFSMEDNIALLKLSAPLQINNYTQPINLPPNHGFQAAGKCTKSGWGTSTGDEEKFSDTMQQIKIRILSTVDCQDALDSLDYADMANIICAGFRENTRNTCIGDDGGPLTCLDDNDKPYLAGILSFDLNCNNEHYPGVYTAVDNYIQWITFNSHLLMLSS